VYLRLFLSWFIKAHSKNLLTSLVTCENVPQQNVSFCVCSKISDFWHTEDRFYLVDQSSVVHEENNVYSI